jgi:LysM repeat protein
MPTSSTSESPPRSITARVLAPLAIVGVLVIVVAMISTTVSSLDDEGGQEQARTEQSKDKEKSQEETYTVQPGDTLSSISIETGISVEKLEQRNPDIDPQTLNAGQVIKLHN